MPARPGFAASCDVGASHAHRRAVGASASMSGSTRSRPPREPGAWWLSWAGRRARQTGTADGACLDLPRGPPGGGECAVGRARGRISRGQIQRARCTQGPGNAARVAFAISGRGASPARAAAPPFSLSPRTAVRVIRGVRARAVLPRRRSYTPARPSAPCTSFVPLPVSHPHLRHPVPAPRARPAQPYSHNPACVFAPPQRPHGRPHRHT